MEKTDFNLKTFHGLKGYSLNKYRKLESKILYKNFYFLDANFLINKNDARYKIFKNKRRNFLVTEPIYDEVNKKDENWGRTIDRNRLDILKFDDLRIKFPATCPVYYNFIQSMHNPANICSVDFFVNKNFSLKQRGKFSDYNKDFNQLVISRFYKGHDNRVKKMEKQGPGWEYYLDSSFLSRLKKRKSIKYKGHLFFNDYRNLSLILIFTLLNRVNSYFITADIDVFCNLFTWLDSMAHQSTFRKMLLIQMKEAGKADLLKNKKLVYYIAFDEFKKNCDELLGDLFIDNWKKRSFSLTVKYWDELRQKFYDEVRFGFNEDIRDLLLNNQGLFLCPFAANNHHGNFFKYQYLWPPSSIHDINTIKISVQAKRFIHARDAMPSSEDHNRKCYYANMEKRNNQTPFFESFRVSG